MTLESSMDPTHKKHAKTHPTTTFNPTAAATAATTAAARGRRHTEQTAAVAASAAAAAAVAHSFPTQKPSSKLKFIQKVRPSSKPANPQPPPTAARRIDTRLQTKAMSLSAMADSSKELLAKPTRLHVTVIGEKKRDLKKTDSKEKLGKPSSKEKEKKDPIDVEKSFASLGLGGRKRFFGSSPVELRDFLSCNGVKIVSVDMPPLMQIHAVDCARKARDSLEKFTAKTLAQTLKKEFDGVYGPAWHCIVGTSFGSFVTHSVGGFLYFSMDQKLYVLLFKTTVQRAAD